MVIVTGTLAYDYIMNFPGSFQSYLLPDHLHNLNLSFIADRFAKRRGGTAGNVSYTLALLKTDHTLFSIAGNDFDDYRNQCKSYQMNFNHVHIISDMHTATGFAISDRNNNQLWGYYYGATDQMHTLSLDEVAHAQDIVLIGPSSAKGSLSLLTQAVNLSLPYMFDPGFILTQISDQDLRFGVSHCTYLIGNEYEIGLIDKRIHLDKFAHITVITTLGNNGAIISRHATVISIPAVKIDVVLDPTGAGDAWRAGFFAGLLRKKNLQICGQIGSVAASYAISAYGTQEHTFTIAEFQQRYRQVFGELVRL